MVSRLVEVVELWWSGDICQRNQTQILQEDSSFIIFPSEGGSCRQETSLHSSDPITRLRIRKHINDDDDDDDGAMMVDGLYLIKLFA